LNIVQLCGAEHASLLLSGRVDRAGPTHQPSIKYAPAIVTIGIVVIMALYGRIAQPLHYNEFADGSDVFGIHHAADVLSNAGFAVVAIWGWLTLWPRRASDRLRAGWPGYRLFLIGLLLTAFGSRLLSPRSRQCPPDLGPAADRVGVCRPAGRRPRRHATRIED
jgi:hypothetical protein